ncbi:GNAT family acetyltransferase [Limnohabitans sp. T6-20]|uniref:GNAT family acetyltransferase n=1 Tax=Limnohabitans sp. T6-20 TaxID=1100725 RepID=UPI000D3D2AC2|nr:GNAT family acetyltransferase [Limnohabitans sp. T6-20]PUE07672.1 GNAT family acetyltransferase [Limnohabitans sp. T6-20]
MHIRPYQASDEAAVVTLWQACDLTRPWNDPHKDIARKLQVHPELFLVGEVQGHLMASAMFGYEGHRGWVNYLAVSPGHQKQGHAKALMQQGEALLLARGCPKINLQVRASNAAVLAFYQSLGYQDDQVVSMGKRLIPDH